MGEQRRDVTLWEATEAQRLIRLIQAGFRLQVGEKGIQVIVGTDVVSEYQPGDEIPDPDTLRKQLAEYCRRFKENGSVLVRQNPTTQNRLTT